MRSNTVTFLTSDGKQFAFPLDFLIERKAVLANKVNGDDLLASMGAYNQLWIPGMPAKFYARDIVSIRFSREDEPPVISEFVDDGHDFVNRPNVSAKARYQYELGDTVVLEGYASDYDQRIIGVRLSFDQGKTWTDCPIENATADKVIYWKFAYTPQVPGRYFVQVRAVNEQGASSPIAATHKFEVVSTKKPEEDDWVRTEQSGQ